MCVLVPTTAETVTRPDCLVPPYERGDEQRIIVVVVQAVVEQTSRLGSPPMVLVGVASSLPKFTPENVMVPPPLSTVLDLSNALTTGASNVRVPTLVPTTADSVIESDLLGPKPLRAWHTTAVEDTQTLLAHEVDPALTLAE